MEQSAGPSLGTAFDQLGGQPRVTAVIQSGVGLIKAWISVAVAFCIHNHRIIK